MDREKVEGMEEEEEEKEEEEEEEEKRRAEGQQIQERNNKARQVSKHLFLAILFVHSLHHAAHVLPLCLSRPG